MGRDNGGVELRDGDTLVAEGNPDELLLDVPDPVSPADATLGLAFANTGVLYPFFGKGFDRKVTLLRPGDEARLAARLTVTRSEYVAVGAASA